MQAIEITRVLRALVRDDGRTLERDHGPRAVEIARKPIPFIGVIGTY